MEIIHTWKIKKLVQRNDGSGTVIQVYFKIYSTDGYYSNLTAGNIELDTENIQDFVPYQNLTESLVLEWVKNKLGYSVGEYEQINVDWINTAKNPPITETKIENLPWG